MEETLFRCTACGKGLRTSQALAGHRRFCKAQKNQKEEGFSEETLRDLRELEQRVRGMETKLAKLVEFHTVPQGVQGGLHKLYFIPEGYRAGSEPNPVVALSSRITGLEAKLDLFKSQITAAQRELKGWLIQVLEQAGLWPLR